MVDLTTFSNNVDTVRFEQTMQSTPTAGIKNLYIADKGIPKEVYSEYANASTFISQNKNIVASIFSTYGGTAPAVSFIGKWKSNSSHVLTYYEFGNNNWIN
jgi:hypothetical protein